MADRASQILKDNQIHAVGFVTGPLWADFKRCLMERRPESPLTSDKPRTAAAKSHERAGFEKCIAEIEAIPFEVNITETGPFDRPAVTETAD